MPNKYKKIKGHFNFEQIYFDQVGRADNNSNFLEIGCYYGKSTIYLAECIKESNKNITLHVIDTFSGEGNSEIEDSFFDNFINNIKTCCVDDLIKVYKGKSFDLINFFVDDFFDFIFIDGSHDYEDVSIDVKNCLKKLKSGHDLAGHDYQYEPVKKAVDDILGSENLSFYQNSWIFKKNSSF